MICRDVYVSETATNELRYVNLCFSPDTIIFCLSMFICLLLVCLLSQAHS